MWRTLLTAHFSLLTSNLPERVAITGAIILAAALAGCTQPPAAQRSPAPTPPPPAVEERALSIIPLSIPVRLGDTDCFTQLAARFSRDGKAIPYREGKIPVAHGQAGLIFSLEPVRSDAPAISYELIEERGGNAVILRFSADAPLPDVALQAAAPTGLLPVRLDAHDQPNVMHSLLGPAWFAADDALYDPQRDRAFGIDCAFQYGQPLGPDQPAILGLLMPARGARQLSVRFKLTTDVIKGRFRWSAPAGGANAADLAAPSWYILRPPGAPPATELEAWLRGNLAFGGALTRIAPGTGIPEIFCAAGVPTSQPALAVPAARRAWKRRLDKSRDIYTRVTQRGEQYNWQHARELLATTVEDYWGQGIVRNNTPGPLLIDAPLSLEHARMWVSLLGLSGQSVVLGDALEKLPIERVELLRAILPPARVRAVDLFEHGLPEQWVLAATREWKLAEGVPAIEPMLIVGVFNFSAEPRDMPIEFEKLMPALVARERRPEARFAVWDVWRHRLVAVARDGFALPMLPATHRVFCIVPVADDRPVLIGAGRHLVQGQLELTDLQWDATRAALSGAVDLPARDPYELRFLVPDGEQSFELQEVQADGATVALRNDGPVRCVTLTADTDTHVRWTALFRPTAQQPEPPAAPSSLKAEQNTRGVHLTWPGRDERAALYRIYRDDRPLAESAYPEYQDTTAEYARQYTYAVSALDYAGQESPRSTAITHQTPIPASTNLTDLVPLLAEQEHLAVMPDTSAAGNALRVGGKRFHRGLGTHTNARIRYHLGAGYERFTGEVGIDDETEGKGSCVFKIVADGETLFTSPAMHGGMPAQPFAVSVRDRMTLELIVTDGGDGADNDHADWGNPYLETRVR